MKQYFSTCFASFPLHLPVCLQIFLSLLPLLGSYHSGLMEAQEVFLLIRNAGILSTSVTLSSSLVSVILHPFRLDESPKIPPPTI